MHISPLSEHGDIVPLRLTKGPSVEGHAGKKVNGSVTEDRISEGVELPSLSENSKSSVVAQMGTWRSSKPFSRLFAFRKIICLD